MTTSDTATGAERARGASVLLYLGTLAVVAPLGAVVGLVSSLCAGWLTRYWEAGQPVPTIAVAALVVYVALLYAGCRLLAWGSGTPDAAMAFTIGFVLSLFAVIGYTPGGDIVLTGHMIHNGYQLGSMLALAAAVVVSSVRGARGGVLAGFGGGR
ncbi:hypothetical protein KIK06_17795 [Nocardiopsis sp. EMB25]|uniref:hypothetical protein n=1 Tax=Nocardiopsis TaxID=2013 RepID=UPI00034917AF|nr:MULTISPECIES: hypothetical protein [Nocardiopsis]MCY9785743.1 hypothetical protein [Nocardiopsis sp. EMB25]